MNCYMKFQSVLVILTVSQSYKLESSVKILTNSAEPVMLEESAERDGQHIVGRLLI